MDEVVIMTALLVASVAMPVVAVFVIPTIALAALAGVAERLDRSPAR